MPSPAAVLTAELHRSYAGNAWHGPALLDVLRDVTAAQAAARPIRGAHTIYELTHHIAAWLGEAASRVRGQVPGQPEDGDFPPPGAIVDEASWAAVRELLARRQAELIQAVSEFDEGRLNHSVNPAGEPDLQQSRSFYALIHGAAQHNAYHGGQIMLLRRALDDGE